MSLFARRYSGNRCCFLFLQVLRCFSSLRWLRATYGFSDGLPGMTPVGLSHSEIRGSKSVCLSPRLFAAYHVLLRLRVPRHPPRALSNLTENILNVEFRIKNLEYESPQFFILHSSFFIPNLRPRQMIKSFLSQWLPAARANVQR